MPTKTKASLRNKPSAKKGTAPVDDSPLFNTDAVDADTANTDNGSTNPAEMIGRVEQTDTAQESNVSDERRIKEALDLDNTVVNSERQGATARVNQVLALKQLHDGEPPLYRLLEGGRYVFWKDYLAEKAPTLSTSDWSMGKDVFRTFTADADIERITRIGIAKTYHALRLIKSGKIEPDDFVGGKSAEEKALDMAETTTFSELLAKRKEDAPRNDKVWFYKDKVEESHANALSRAMDRASEALGQAHGAHETVTDFAKLEMVTGVFNELPVSFLVAWENNEIGNDEAPEELDKDNINTHLMRAAELALEQDVDIDAIIAGQESALNSLKAEQARRREAAENAVKLAERETAEKQKALEKEYKRIAKVKSGQIIQTSTYGDYRVLDTFPSLAEGSSVGDTRIAVELVVDGAEGSITLDPNDPSVTAAQFAEAGVLTILPAPKAEKATKTEAVQADQPTLGISKEQSAKKGKGKKNNAAPETSEA